MDGFYKEWEWQEVDYKNGEIIEVKQFIKTFETHYKNGKKDGVEKKWYEYGRKKSLKHFKNGIENGVRKEWDKDGTLTFEGNYIDGGEEIK